MAIETVEVLGRVPLLAGFQRRELERLARQFRERVFSEGAVITSEGEPGVGFFVIAEGSASVNVGGDARASLGPGDYFGEMALIDEGPRSATVVAATDLRCLALTPWEFRPFVEDHPAVAWAMLQMLAQRLRDAQAD
jgi:CRP/FNR family transcriptional regulator, cyclic AMP receptor protein